MADSINIGNYEVSSFKVGSSDCKIYLGDTLLYPTTPPTPTFKWFATYSDSSTSSAECDSSSAITEGEITPEELETVEIGDCVTSIGDYAFMNCFGITSINISNSVTSIGNYSFQYCDGITSVTIGSNVTTIGDSAFYYCSSLTSVTIKATTPPTLGSNAFANTNDCPIYVPSGSVETYKSASGWSNYASRIQAEPPTLQIISGDSLFNLSAISMSVSTAVTLSESHNVTFGDISSNTYTLLYENGNWYNWRLVTNGAYTPDNKTLLTPVNGYYTIIFDSTYPCLGADADEYGQGGTMNATFDFKVSGYRS